MDLSEFRNPEIAGVLEDAASITLDIGLREIEPLSVLVALNQRYTEELDRYFTLCGVDSGEFYRQLIASVDRYPKASGGGNELKLSRATVNALYVALEIEKNVGEMVYPNSALVTGLLMTSGPLKQLADSFGITTSKMQAVVTARHTEPSDPAPVGLEDEIRKIEEFVQAASTSRGRAVTDRLECDAIIIGETGAGKNFLAEYFTHRLHDAGLIRRREPMVIDAVNWTNAERQLDETLENYADGVLVVDNAQKLVSDRDAFNIGSLDSLFSAMSYPGKRRPVVMLIGLPEGMNEFMATNRSVVSKFEYVFNLKEYSAEEYARICETTLQQKFGERLDAACRQRLTGVFRHLLGNKPSNWAGAHSARKKADSIFMSFSMSGNRQITPENIPGEVYREVTLEEVLAEMDRDFVGMESVKSAVRNIATSIEADIRRSEAGIGERRQPGVHMLLTGNPGTGKTTVARTLGKVFKAIHLLPSDKVIEADKSALVGQYVGSTPPKVNELIDRAMGGILFIDEAYTLSENLNSGNSFGHEAIETLMKRMEDDRGKFVCVMAGYRDLMEEFVHVNPGIDSRITHRIHIDDYSADELYEIFVRMSASQGMKLAPEAKDKARRAIEEMVTVKTKDFGNARDIRKLLDKTLERQSSRLRGLTATPSVEDLALITADDIAVEGYKEIDERECLARLDGLVGLVSVKREIRNLTQYLRLEKMRAESMGKKFAGVRDHYLLLGNPGTGKTTVARILGEIFLSLGISKNTRFVETDRSGLVAGYVGQTAPLVNRVIDSALGGILFIDEAYSLSQGPNDSFGQEAIDALLKRMEDDRGKFVCIAAGYSKEMQKFIASNSGLRSRFNKVINFDDYDEAELVEIFRRKIAAEGLNVSPDAEPAMAGMVSRLMSQRTPGFGNAREINNLLQLVKENQSNRLYRIISNGSKPSPEELFTLVSSDFKQ